MNVSHFAPERATPWFAVSGVAALAAGVAMASAPGILLVVVSVGLLAAACWSGRDGFLLFGPFVRAELTRQTRKHRVHLWRTLVLVFLAVPTLVLLFFVAGPVAPEDRLPREKAQAIAEGVFLMVFFYLFLFVTSIAATFISTAVTEDREAKRIDFLLVTDLRGREVVAGKSLARAAGAYGYFLPTLPVLLVLPALFGVSADMLLLLAAYGVVTTFSICGLAAYGSVTGRNKKEAGQKQWKFLLPYFLFCWAGVQLAGYPAVWFFPGTNTNQPPVSVGDAVEAVSIGNPLMLLPSISGAVTSGINLAPLQAALPRYAAFHITAGLLFFMFAARRLRPMAAEFAGEGPSPVTVAAAAKRPAVFERPIIWKEMYAIPAQWQTARGVRTARLLGWAFAYVPALVFLAAAVSDLGGYADNIRTVAKFAPPLIAWVGTVAGMNLAALCIARERERDTLPSLLTTDLGPREIFRQKFLGVLGAGRGIFYWQLIVGIPAVVAGAYLWWAFAGLVVTHVVFTLVGVTLGLYVTAFAPTAEKAARSSALLLFGGLGGSALLAGGLLALTNGAEFTKFVCTGLVPPAMFLMFGQAHFAAPADMPFWVAGVSGGWLLYLGFSGVMYRLARLRFLRQCDKTQEGAEPLLRSVADDKPRPAPVEGNV